MKVSIIITSFNRPEFVHAALDSAKNQTYRNTEVIVVDASTTPVMGLSANKQFWIEDNGISQARNFGAKEATGDAFIFLDDDNILLPTYVEKTTPFLTHRVGFVTTTMRVFSSHEESYVRARMMTVDQLKNENQIHISSLVSRKAFEQAGGFKDDVYEDWELWLNILKLGWRMAIVKEPLFHYRSHEPSLITRHKERHDERIANMRRIHADIY